MMTLDARSLKSDFKMALDPSLHPFKAVIFYHLNKQLWKRREREDTRCQQQ